MILIKLRSIGSLAAITLAAAALLGTHVNAAPAVSSRSELDWARAALANRSRLKIVSADPATGLITVQAPRAIARSSASGAVVLSGPGYWIREAAPSRAPHARETRPSATGAHLLAGMPLERRDHPIVCQGPRLLHIDSRNLRFAGDAIEAEDGCEIHITNSKIVAKGVGIVARRASVHIDNSSISGAEGAISASHGAAIYARLSTFKGVIRQSRSAAFHDLGGNAGD